MRSVGTALLFVALNLGICCSVSADDVATIEAIDNAAGELDEAFVKQDAEAITSLTTPDHVAVTHYYGEPTTGSGADRLAARAQIRADQPRPSRQ